MIILPAIDICGGTCVRLRKGEFNTAQKVAEDPKRTAAAFREAGAGWMHMVDLDGAKSGTRPNRGLIRETAASSGLKVELGGGIRDMPAIDDYLSHGISRVILGSVALSDPSLVREAVARYGERIAVGIDARNGLVATNGWLRTSDVSYLDFARAVESAGVKVIIFTDIDCDGTLAGPNFGRLEKLRDAVSCRIIASGGIRDIGHIRRLGEMGLYGAICGKSIYSGTLDLAQAIQTGGDQNAG